MNGCYNVLAAFMGSSVGTDTLVKAEVKARKQEGELQLENGTCLSICLWATNSAEKVEEQDNHNRNHSLPLCKIGRKKSHSNRGYRQCHEARMEGKHLEPMERRH